MLTTTEILVADLEDMAPGAELGVLLARVDYSRLNGHQIVTVSQAEARQVAHYQARFYTGIGELPYCPPGNASSHPDRHDDYDEFASDEIRAALALTRRSADNQLDLAGQLRDHPTVRQALKEGGIDLSRARAIVDAVDGLDDTVAGGVVEEVVEGAGELTTGQLRGRLRRLIISVDPQDATRRLQEGTDERRVVSYPNPDGTANLTGMSLPPDRVAGIMANINHHARAARGEGDSRTIDQVRSDVFLDLLEGTHTTATTHRSAVVDIRVDLSTLLGLDDNPGEIPGWGPVISDIARNIVERQHDDKWQVTVTDPDTGAILSNGTTRRRPTAQQQRWVETQHPTCRFPGCRMPSIDCDLDHTEPREDGGETLVANLEPLCRHDHRLKHEAGWQLTPTSNNDYTWTSPHGHTYTTTGQSP
ncbi:MAG: DUF222 domain-containing protein [Acidimicrobiia bacterium]|nr:DUF222 domain-containing protein [Acidimicrobiia bacterium]